MVPNRKFTISGIENLLESNLQMYCRVILTLEWPFFIQNPIFKANVQEEGTIALKIFVDTKGKVVRTIVEQEASNSGSAYLIRMAKETALTMRYEEKEGVPFEYVGIKLFKFKKV